MEKAKLIVKNFGPLKDIEIEVREMVTFIGAQASGKSTLAKLIAIFEDENFKKDKNISFENELKKYNIFSYLKNDTFISFDNTKNRNISSILFQYENKKFHRLGRVNLFNLSDNELKRIEIFKDFINFDLNNLILYNNNNKLKFLKLFRKNRKEILAYIFNSKIYKFDINKLFELSKIEQKIENYKLIYDKIINLFPQIYSFDSLYIPSERNFLHLIAENTLGLINNNVQIPKHLLNTGQDYEKAIQTIKDLPISIIDKKLFYKREGKSSYIYHNQNDKVDLLESASGLQTVVPILLLVEYAKSLKDNYNFNFVVEEPELNIYPKAQHELIKYLVKNCLFDRKNLILTTHSPFVLASINNLLLAFDKGQSKPNEVAKIIKKESWLNPKNFIAYQLKNGKAYKIMDDKLGQIKENMIDNISDEFSDEFNKILDL